MRRPTRKARLYNQRVRRKRTARARRYIMLLERHRRWWRKQKVIHLMAPVVFGVQRPDTLTELVRFLTDLRHVVGIRKRRVRIDFANTRKMIAGGTLLFAAELSRLRQIVGEKMMSCSYPTDDVVAQVLKQVGVFDLLGQSRECAVTAENVKYWRVISGTNVDTERLEELCARRLDDGVGCRQVDDLRAGGQWAQRVMSLGLRA